MTALAVSVGSFAPSLLNQSARRAPLTPSVLAHAAFMAGWLTLYLVQALLAVRGRLTVHKRLGPAAAVVAAGVVVTGYQATLGMIRRGYDSSGDLSVGPGGALSQTVFMIGSLVAFAVLVGTAIVLRRRPLTHKRLMTLATIQSLMAAPLAHLVGHYRLPGLILPAWGVGVLLVMIAHDRRSRGGIHPASLWGGLGLVILGNVEAVVIGPSQIWQQFIAWLGR
ncbi:MAG: hypothetical protein ABJC89_18980 [Acidobacteriota bacterium]